MALQSNVNLKIFVSESLNDNVYIYIYIYICVCIYTTEQMKHNSGVHNIPSHLIPWLKKAQVGRDRRHQG